MWGAIIGGALSVGSSIFGGISSARSAKRQRDAQLAAQRGYLARLGQQLNENESWYNKKYYEDPTTRADSTRLLTILEDNIRKRNRAAEGKKAVIGGTDESVAAEKEQNNKMYADTVSQIYADNENRKERIDAEYRRRKDDINNSANEALMSQELVNSQYEDNRQAAISSGIQGALNAGASIASAWGSSDSKKTDGK